jgi:hypothetical protein
MVRIEAPPTRFKGAAHGDEMRSPAQIAGPRCAFAAATPPRRGSPTSAPAGPSSSPIPIRTAGILLTGVWSARAPEPTDRPDHPPTLEARVIEAVLAPGPVSLAEGGALAEGGGARP